MVDCRHQHADGGRDGSKVAVRGGAHTSRRPQPVQRELSGAGARQLRAGRQVGRPTHTWQSVPRGRTLNTHTRPRYVGLVMGV